MSQSKESQMSLLFLSLRAKHQMFVVRNVEQPERLLLLNAQLFEVVMFYVLV
jgi:hypothetical protein